MGCVYFIGAEDGPIKIGWSNAGNASKRLSELQTGNPRDLKVYGVVGGRPELEPQCHRHLRGARIRGEWFEREAALRLLEHMQPKTRTWAKNHRRAECDVCAGTGRLSGPWSNRKLDVPCHGCQGSDRTPRRAGE